MHLHKPCLAARIDVRGHPGRPAVAVVVAIEPGGLSPEGFRHAVGRVLAQRSGDMYASLGLAELRVSEYLLNHADADAVVEQQGRGRVAGVVEPGVA